MQNVAETFRNHTGHSVEANDLGGGISETYKVHDRETGVDHIVKIGYQAGGIAGLNDEANVGALYLRAGYDKWDKVEKINKYTIATEWADTHYQGQKVLSSVAALTPADLVNLTDPAEFVDIGVLDFVVNNTDRHGENAIMVGTPDRSETHIVPIDHNLSMHEKASGMPDNLLYYLKNSYGNGPAASIGKFGVLANAAVDAGWTDKQMKGLSDSMVKRYH
ncbi:MAG: hypothetical protein ABJC62_13140 [Frankiaceae bacterium]